jgi:uncharacterized protein (TIRG00374 family)
MTSPPEIRPDGRIWAVRSLKGAVAVLALVATWRFFTHANVRWADLEAQVMASDPWFLLLGVAFLLGRFAIWDWRFRLACRRTIGESSGVFLGFFVLLASAALNLITPTARVIGGLMRARYFARSSGRTFGRLYGAVLYDQLAHHAVFIACTWLAVIAMAFEVGKDRLGVAGALALGATVAALVLWSRRGGAGAANPVVRFLARRAETSDGRMQQLYAHGHEAVEVFVQLLGVPRLRAQAVALGVTYFLVQGLAQYWIFLALGARLDLTVVLAGVAVGNAAGTLSGTPGGAGTTELAMVPSFVAMGLSPALAMAGTLLFRGLHYLLVLAVGLPALAALELRGKQPLLKEAP